MMEKGHGKNSSRVFCMGATESKSSQEFNDFMWWISHKLFWLGKAFVCGGGMFFLRSVIGGTSPSGPCPVNSRRKLLMLKYRFAPYYSETSPSTHTLRMGRDRKYTRHF